MGCMDRPRIVIVALILWATGQLAFLRAQRSSRVTARLRGPAAVRDRNSNAIILYVVLAIIFGRQRASRARAP